MIPICTEAEQARTDARLEAHKPPFAGFVAGLLLPSGSTKCALVDIPIRLGLEDAMSPMDLDTTWWIAAGERPNASSIDQEKLSVTITHWPLDDSVPLTRAYTVFVAPQMAFGEPETHDTHPPSKSIDCLVPGLLEPWRGNVLVVRSAPRASGSGVNDMTEKDTYQAKAIVRRRVNLDPLRNNMLTDGINHRVIVERLVGVDAAPYFSI